MQLLRIFLLVVLVVSGIASTTAWKNDAEAQAKLLCTQGIVSQSRWEKGYGGYRRPWRCIVDYSYFVRGKRYEGSFQEGFSCKAECKDYSRQAPEGGKVAVYFDSGDPGKSSLKPETFYLSFPAPALFFLCTLMFIVCIEFQARTVHGA